ncbi:hypothetical protein [Burkholderia mayonis]|uniref:hypothetical protein n=1 Tax=Burkholderia mayonis TaxID=1385591 RepID=UPI000B330F09|nr:hypothetical protein [Burkholderia mayonis]
MKSHHTTPCRTYRGRVIEPGDDWLTRGLDEWMGEGEPLSSEELALIEDARQDRCE